LTRVRELPAVAPLPEIEEVLVELVLSSREIRYGGIEADAGADADALAVALATGDFRSAPVL
jgi:hypothetical protein